MTDTINSAQVEQNNPLLNSQQNTALKINSGIIAPEELSGTVERVTYHSEESGFCVLRIKVAGNKDLITVTGLSATISPGEYVNCQGSFINDRQYGLQFKSTHIAVLAPGTIEGIEKYLASGLIKGIGPHFAKKIVQAFGQDLFTIIEQSPETLLNLPGVGRSRLEAVISGWLEQKAIREIMIFLQSYGVGTARAVRIYKTYGNDAISKVRENPYKLALDIHGIGFKTADTVAQKLGIPSDSIMRAQAGVRHALQELASQGHCAYPYEELVNSTSSLLGIDITLAERAIEEEISAGNIVLLVREGHPFIYLKALYEAEKEVCEHLLRLNSGQSRWAHLPIAESLAKAQEDGIELSPSQIKAFTSALTDKVLVITGGPGVGKTTLVKSILKVLSAQQAAVLLCAPTGRAAKRLAESTGLPAKTIHRLLEFDPKDGGFKRNKNNLLQADIVIVDETSMIDIVLANKLLQAIPSTASLLLIGDIDQLPSVGPGSVLSDIIESKIINTVFLTEIFRQAASSKIIVNAHRINQGDMPEIDNNPDELTDYYFIAAETAQEITSKLLTVVCERIPKRFGFHPINDIQVLTPMNRGGLGARALNIELQKRLNGDSDPENTVTKFGSTYAGGDKVIQVVNNYDKEIFNGDIGTIYSVDKEEGFLLIDFDGRLIEYEINELDELSLAYAVSIHKAQGSEYKAVVIPVSTAHYLMLERNLIYTGLTRGKQLVVLIGQKKALAMAVHNKRSLSRVTSLKHRLQELV